MVEAGLLSGPEVAASVREALGPLLGERDERGEFVFPLPPSARVDTLLLGCTHYPLLRAAIAEVAGDGIAIVDSAAATASALAELLSINDIQAATGSSGAHQQLTTGDVDAFRAIAERMFGESFPDVAGVELEATVPRA
jgi:glutamate racemase